MSSKLTILLMCFLFWVMFTNIDKAEAEDAANSLKGKVLIMSAENWDPWLTISEDNSGNVGYSGVMAKLLEFLQETLNFTTVLVRPPDGTWGAPDSNGKWGGMVGQVNRCEADFALGTSFILQFLLS